MKYYICDVYENGYTREMIFTLFLLYQPCTRYIKRQNKFLSNSLLTHKLLNTKAPILLDTIYQTLNYYRPIIFLDFRPPKPQNFEQCSLFEKRISIMLIEGFLISKK